MAHIFIPNGPGAVLAQFVPIELLDPCCSGMKPLSALAHRECDNWVLAKCVAIIDASIGVHKIYHPRGGFPSFTDTTRKLWQRLAIVLYRVNQHLPLFWYNIVFKEYPRYIATGSSYTMLLFVDHPDIFHLKEEPCPIITLSVEFHELLGQNQYNQPLSGRNYFSFCLRYDTILSPPTIFFRGFKLNK